MDDVKKPYLSGRTYDAARWVSQIALPAFGAAYFGISQTWGLPAGEEVVGTSAILGTLLGTLLGLSRRNYQNSDSRFDGTVHVIENAEDPEESALAFSLDAEKLMLGKNELSIKVVSPPK